MDKDYHSPNGHAPDYAERFRLEGGIAEEVWEEAKKEGWPLDGPIIADTPASSIETKPVEWLWYGRIPKGKLTMFDGDPGVGKSVVTMAIAAIVSTGRTFPDDAPCKEAGNVLIANLEDAADDTVVPRLKAHGANLKRVSLFSDVPDSDAAGGKRTIEIPQDIKLLEALVKRRSAKLLIIDPVLTVLGGDANKDQEARKALTPVKDMAERTGCAVVAVRHLNKNVSLKAIQRGGGNMGLIGVARAGSFFAEHPDDDSLKVMAVHKANLAEKLPSLCFQIVNSEVHHTARIEWKGVSDHDANSLATGPDSPMEKSKQDEAREFLREELSDKPIMSKQIFQDAREAGISEGTLRIAKTQLGVKSEKLGTEGWAWVLPARKEDHLEPLAPLAPLAPSKSARPESAYLSEDDKDDKDDKGAKDDNGTFDGYYLPLPSGEDGEDDGDLVF